MSTLISGKSTLRSAKPTLTSAKPTLRCGHVNVDIPRRERRQCRRPRFHASSQVEARPDHDAAYSCHCSITRIRGDRAAARCGRRIVASHCDAVWGASSPTPSARATLACTCHRRFAAWLHYWHHRRCPLLRATRRVRICRLETAWLARLLFQVGRPARLSLEAPSEQVTAAILPSEARADRCRLATRNLQEGACYQRSDFGPRERCGCTGCEPLLYCVPGASVSARGSRR